MPKRIQRKRTKGWRMPEGCVYVGRPTKWGNPFVVGEMQPWRHRRDLGGTIVTTAEQAVALYRQELIRELNRGDPASDRALDMVLELRGKDLACFCPLDQPCHADVLLELANAQPEKGDDHA